MFAADVKKGFNCIAVTMLLCGLTLGVETSSKLAFTSDGNGGYKFDTGVLRGTLCANGKPQGLTSVTYIPSEARLDRGTGILGYYRVFTTKKRYGTAAWEWPGTTKLLPDGTVRVSWPAAADRPFDMNAVYRWKDPQRLDVETTVKAQKDLSNFESFVASYFDPAFPSPFAYVNESPKAQGMPGLLLAEKSSGDWQIFPRDADSLPIIEDGRWSIEPNPLKWAIMPELEGTIALRRAAKGLVVMVMAPEGDCFAVATPCEGETHYSLYLSLFGRDIKAGETAKARTRFMVANKASDEQIITMYRQYRVEPPPQAGPAKAPAKAPDKR